jgi:hypothetical protein
MSPLENFWHKDKNNKELNAEIGDRVEEAFASDFEIEERGDIPPGLTDTNFFTYQQGIDKAKEIYEWYSKAIRRRDRLPLDEPGFLHHFFDTYSREKKYMYGNNQDGYLLGVTKRGVFVPTHFAPRTLRGGYNLIHNLGASQSIPCVMAITDDLVETIEKMPSWSNAGISFPSWFRNQVQNKQIVYNSHPDMEKLLPLLAQDYLDEADRTFNNEPDYDEDDYYEDDESVG